VNPNPNFTPTTVTLTPNPNPTASIAGYPISTVHWRKLKPADHFYRKWVQAKMVSLQALVQVRVNPNPNPNPTTLTLTLAFTRYCHYQYS